MVSRSYSLLLVMLLCNLPFVSCVFRLYVDAFVDKGFLTKLKLSIFPC